MTEVTQRSAGTRVLSEHRRGYSSSELQWEIVPKSSIGRDVWDCFVEGCPSGWLWHRYDFTELWNAWPGRCDLSFGVLDRSTLKLVATIPLFKTEGRLARLLRWNVLDVFGGIALDGSSPEKHQTIILDRIYETLRSTAKRHHAHEIRFSIAPMTPSVRGDNCPLVNPLLKIGGFPLSTHAWICDLRKSTSELWAKFGKGAKSSVHKAQKQGVKVRFVDPDSSADECYHLHCETYNRTGASPQNRNYFFGIWDAFVKTGLSSVFIAERDGEAVAFAMFAVYKGGGYYWNGASNAAGLASGANSLLQWEGMQWMVSSGVEWYDVGEAFLGRTAGKLKQLSDFKKDFGGSLFPHFRATVNVKKRTQTGIALARTFWRQVIRGHELPHAQQQ